MLKPVDTQADKVHIIIPNKCNRFIVGKRAIFNVAEVLVRAEPLMFWQ